MSLHDYKKAIDLAASPAVTFEALIMAAVRKVGCGSEELRVAFPHI